LDETISQQPISKIWKRARKSTDRSGADMFESRSLVAGVHEQPKLFVHAPVFLKHLGLPGQKINRLRWPKGVNELMNHDIVWN